MVNGKEIIFEDVDEALKYVLQQEKVSLENDEFRQKPPLMVSTSSLFNYPLNLKKWGEKFLLIVWTPRFLLISMRLLMMKFL